MKVLDKHFDSARRHFGVALIDLNYAAADLARSAFTADMQPAAATALELLNREIERLIELSAFIERVADGDQDRVDPALVQRWWPHLVRGAEPQPARD